LLKHLLFPVCGFTKAQVRARAKKLGLSVHNQRDSQEICFVAGKDHNDFLRQNLKLKSGPIVTVDGKKIGEHSGLPLYTIGQRRGVEIGGTGPYYVVEKNFVNNTLVVADNNNHPALFKNNLLARDVNWISGQAPKLPCRVKARIRYRHPAVSAVIDKNYQVTFKKPQRAVTPGQSVVFYKGKVVLGGGIIS
jgi:tRNA-specific 2-thiouridylase